MKQDGLADSSLIRNWDIKVSSNEEHKTNMRPGASGWTPETGDNKKIVSLYVGDALIYGASVKLPKSQCVKTYDVVLSGMEGDVESFKVGHINTLLY